MRNGNGRRGGDVERLRAIAKKGGQTTAARHGSEHYAAIGRKGAARMRELLARGRAAEAQEGGG